MTDIRYISLQSITSDRFLETLFVSFYADKQLLKKIPELSINYESDYDLLYINIPEYNLKGVYFRDTLDLKKLNLVKFPNIQNSNNISADIQAIETYINDAFTFLDSNHDKIVTVNNAINSKTKYSTGIKPIDMFMKNVKEQIIHNQFQTYPQFIKVLSYAIYFMLVTNFYGQRRFIENHFLGDLLLQFYSLCPNCFRYLDILQGGTLSEKR